MTQPEHPTPARGTRPQLFGAPRERRSQQPDFGPSILATIDGTPRRDAGSRDSRSVRRVLMMAGLALLVVAVYLVLKLSVLRTPTASPMLSSAPAPTVVARTGEPQVLPSAASVPLATVAASAPGAAAIENVPPPVVASAASDVAVSPAVPSASAAITASIANVRQALAGSDTSETRRVDKPAVAPREVPKEPLRETAKEPVKDPVIAMRGAALAAEPTPVAAAKPAGKSGGDSDAELLAAMLPHLKRSIASPTSPAYEKRCGQFTGDAAIDCRAKFCTGREGSDPACPAPAPAAAR